jgi:hypothetical protein
MWGIETYINAFFGILKGRQLLVKLNSKIFIIAQEPVTTPVVKFSLKHQK